MANSVEVIMGSRTSFGTRDVEQKAPAKIPQDGLIQEIKVELDGDNLPAYLANDETSKAFKGGEYIVEWIAYSADNTTAAVQPDLVGHDDGVTLGLTEPALDVTSDTWAKSTTAIIVPEAAQIVATGPAAGEVAYLIVRYIDVQVV